KNSATVPQLKAVPAPRTWRRGRGRGRRARRRGCCQRWAAAVRRETGRRREGEIAQAAYFLDGVANPLHAGADSGQRGRGPPAEIARGRDTLRRGSQRARRACPREPARLPYSLFGLVSSA